MNVADFYMSDTAEFYIGSDFMNSDSASYFAHFINDGYMYTGGDWMNTSIIEGYTGSFEVELASTNTGSFIGTFDFCDLTPPASWPYIDYNSGVLGDSITFCGVLAIDDIEITENISINPNPIQDIGYIVLNTDKTVEYSINIFDISGKRVKSYSGIEFNTITIDGTDLSNGIYTVEMIINNKNVYNQKLIKN
jgi:hypothetical protein